MAINQEIAVQALKLRRVQISGFKSLGDFNLHIPGNRLILIGPNGAGKSTVLQALAFIEYVAKGQPISFFDERHWAIRDICPQPGGLYTLYHKFRYRLLLERDDGKRIYWHFLWSPNSKSMEEEEVWVAEREPSEPRCILHFSPKNQLTVVVDGQPLGAIQSRGSLMALLDLNALPSELADVFRSLKAWGERILSMELLNPMAMRRGSRVSPNDIGPQGERLAGFLASLSQDGKARIVERVKAFYPLRHIETTPPREGWIDLKIAESFTGFDRIGSAHMSDGFMRMLGMAAIPEFNEAASAVLLDEIEDGIGAHILPRFIDMITREAKIQLIATSHSPVLVNGFEPDEIAFLGRTGNGRTVAASFKDIESLGEGSEYFGPGELWTMMDVERLNESVLAANQKKPVRKTFDVQAFMEGR
ncbi:MAG: AAA family ATPase [Alphaproteobacteria bacterium]|nr:AAA family ATPase [Alphaproteobacteria bacterium]